MGSLKRHQNRLEPVWLDYVLHFENRKHIAALFLVLAIQKLLLLRFYYTILHYYTRNDLFLLDLFFSQELPHNYFSIILKEELLQDTLKILRLKELLRSFLEIRPRIEIGLKIEAVIHKIHALLQHSNTIVFPWSQQIDLKLVHKFFHTLSFDTFLHKLSQQGFEVLLKGFTGVVVVDAFQSHRKSSQFRLVVTSKAQILRNSSLYKLLIYLGITLFQEYVSQQPQRHRLKRSDLIIQSKEVIDRDVVCLCSLRNNGLVFLFRRLREQLRVFVEMALILVFVQVFFGQEIEGVFDAVVSVKVKGHVGRMVIVLVHLLQLFVLEIDNILWSSSGVINIRGSLEQYLIDLLDHLPIRVLIGSLHLVQDYSLQLSFSILSNLVSPSFLPEIELIQQGTKGHIEVNSVEIAPIRWVCRREGITCEIVSSPSIHVGVD